ncbi:MAG: SGNH/GDSL hydrolase family protein [Lentisphaeria bacterium]|nr:SGNH/GDSL hydrolase family protein [Lentisphaeria bacterium]
MRIMALGIIAGLTGMLNGFAFAAEAGGSQLIPVDSPAFVFSPGNWVGDEGRGGRRFRQTWNSYAYCRVAWESKAAEPRATLLLDTSTFTAAFKPLRIAYAVDGVWKSQVSAAERIPLENLKRAGQHELTVVFHWSEQKERWGTPGQSGLNILRITGLEVDAGSVPIPAQVRPKWALILGDSITEGCGASELSCYSHLVGQALLTMGYEYGVSACGWSGWLNKGDNPPGDVPGYYIVRNSVDGVGGEYDETVSRWNKIDGNHHSLLDARGRLSAYGGTDQEPALILLNYGTNDGLHKSNPSDTKASINQGLAALRSAAPNAQIVVLIPFGQYYAKDLKDAVAARQNAPEPDRRIALIDLGPSVARSIAGNGGVLGGLHPNDRGHANFAAAIIPQIARILPEE